jgi:hypothetical protein
MVNASMEEENIVIMIKIQGETLAMMRIGEILSKQHLDSLMKEIDLMSAPNNASDDWIKKSKVLSIIGNLFRYLDFENFLKPYSERFLKLFSSLGKENHPRVRDFYVHYCQ